MVRVAFAQDVDPAEADIMAVVQKPINQSIFARNLVLRHGNNFRHGSRFLGAITRFLLIYNVFCKKINATTVTVNASHASYISHPEETAE